MKKKKRVRRYIMNVLIAIDQLGNAAVPWAWGTFAGDPDETISSALGKLKEKHGGTIPKRFPIAKFTDWFLDKIDKNHSIDAIEEDEGKNRFFRRKKKRSKRTDPPTPSGPDRPAFA